MEYDAVFEPLFLSHEERYAKDYTYARRCVQMLHINEQAFLAMFGKYMQHLLPRFTPWPADAIVQRVYYNYERGTFDIMIQSSEFMPVESGCIPPSFAFWVNSEIVPGEAFAEYVLDLNNQGRDETAPERNIEDDPWKDLRD